VIAFAEEFPVRPYTDPAQFDCPWPQSSHYRQPWSAYIETKSGADFLNGLGVNLHIPDGTENLALRLLAETGFRAVRIEVGWGESNWDETALSNEAKFRQRFELCAKYRLRPTILINAHHGVPCPLKSFKRTLVADAPKGATNLRLDSTADLVVERSGLSGLTEYWAAEALITGIDEATGEVTLSKPLPKDLKAGEISMATLKHPPLYPAATMEFDETAAALAAHAVRVGQLARQCGIKEFDFEIWNELTFGTHFLNIDDYFDPAAPKVTTRQPDFLNSGGRCWELAKRIAAAVKPEFPESRCIWGFSNTTFFHCPIEKLPPGMDGQSYHPYGTSTRKIDAASVRNDQPVLEGFVPAYEMRMPEGWAPTFIQTECLLRLLNPLDRLTRRPAGSTRFFHYLTEHGVLPTECGVKDDAGAWLLKSVCATRSFLLWLNKGVDTLHYFDAFEDKATSFGLLPVNLRSLAADAKFDDVATAPMRAVRNLARMFEGSIPLDRTNPLQIEVTALGIQTKVFEGDDAHAPLWHREVFTALPFQIDANRHVVAVYVMTRDATKPLAPQPYRLKISGTKARTVTCYDPHDDCTIKVESAYTSDALEVTVPVGAHPRLLTLAP